MKKLLFGLATAIAISLPVVAQAQSFDPFPNDPDCHTIQNHVCHYIDSDGNPFVMAIPDGYNGQYLLGLTFINGAYLAFVYDTRFNEGVASMSFTIDREISIIRLDGDVDYLYETTPEVIHLIDQLMLK